MLIPHTFNAETHSYRVDNEFVLSTSAVIQLNGLSDMASVPKNNLAHAGSRGSLVHEAIYHSELGYGWHGMMVEAAFAMAEEDAPFGPQLLISEVEERMKFYQKWRSEHSFKLIGKMEQSRVYRHVGTEQLIGATPDMPALIDGEVFVIDTKTCFKQFGQKQQQLMLKWEAQLQSYKEALEAEDGFVAAMHKAGKDTIRRAILHLHPSCGKNGIKDQQSGYEFHTFEQDSEPIWDSMIRVATAKITHGYKIGGSE